MNDLWVLFAVAALLLRAGFALNLAGISRSKNTVSTLFRAMVEIAIGILAYWAIGAAIHGSWRELGNPRGSNALFVAATFLIGPAVIAGAALERSRTVVCIASAAMMPGIVTPLAWKILQCNWIARTGFIDEAGATYIHFSAGVAAAVIALALGPRLGKYNRDGSTNAVLGHNLPLATMGILLIFIMWISYVVGYAADGPRAALNAVLAGSAGLLAASAYCSISYGRQDVFLVYAGLLGGLVSITAGADRLIPLAAVAAGAIAGVIIPYVIVRLDLVWKIDDPAGGIAIHGLGGIWSALAVAILAPGSWSQRADRLCGEAIALVVVGALTLAIAGAVFLVLRATVGIRIREADEFDGLDLSEFDLNAYPDFQQTTIKSYHLREM
jgi:ammonium transporter, Amt family